MPQEAEARTTMTSYAETVAWITGLMPFGIKPGLKRMELLMEMLGHPERRLAYVHVAGTNGKGSVCSYLTRVLIENGYDVGTFTSPYIERYSNRIKYNNQDIPDEDLIRLANQLRPCVEELAAGEWGSPTMFEVSTALAILYFGTVTYPDFVIWETGLGGRLDSTNIVTPLVSVITNIGHDHLDILGDSLEQITREKAGIIKPGVPVVTAVEQPELLAVIEQQAAEKKSTVYAIGRRYQYTVTSSELNRQCFHWQGPFRQVPDLTIRMNGSHQVKNAALALMALEVLRQYSAVVLEDEQVLAGFQAAEWPGRLELIAENPRVLLDGAHNPEGAATLAEALQGNAYPRRKLHFMMGMLTTKNHTGYLKHILPLVDTLILTQPDIHKRMEAGNLGQLAAEVQADLGLAQGPVRLVEPDWKKALAMLLEMTGPEDLAVVSGTLYLISDVRTWMLYRTDSEKGW